MALFENMTITKKLIISFGALILLILILAAFSFGGTIQVTEKIRQTEEVSMPVALASARAQADLLRMVGAMRGYLVLGEPAYRENYEQAQHAFETDLNRLQAYTPYFEGENQARLQELEATFEAWTDWPEELFEIRDDRIRREPAHAKLVSEGTVLSNKILTDLSVVMAHQRERELTPELIDQMVRLAEFQHGFTEVLFSLQSYANTRQETFKGQYSSGRSMDRYLWEIIWRDRELYDAAQQQRLIAINQNLQEFWQVADEIIQIVESEHWREDLYLFRTEVEPLSDQMLQLLDEIVVHQQATLQTELSAGRQLLSNIRTQSGLLGLLGVAAGLIMAIAFGQSIIGPIKRLTGTVTQITDGNLNVKADVTSSDEIGILAGVFNTMTERLRRLIDTLEDRVRQRTHALTISAEVSRQITAILDLEELFTYVTRRMQREFEFYQTNIYLVEEESGQLILAESKGEAAETLKAAEQRIQPGEGVVGMVVETNEPFMSNNVQMLNSSMVNPILTETQSELATPLRKGEKMLGVLDIHSREPDHFTEADISLMQSIGDQVAIAIDNIRLYSHMEEMVRERTAELQVANERMEELIEAQQSLIAELSTPIIPITEGITVLPLIGEIDTGRAKNITRALLAGIDQHQAKIVIIDITGVPIMDSAVAGHLDRTIRAARLKGAHTIITGISEDVAETIVALGIDWSELETVSNLQRGLKRAIHRLSKRV